MKPSILTILLLLVFHGAFSPFLSSFPVSNGIDLLKKTGTKNDTSDVNRYTRNALAYVSKPLKIDYIKANIDSAELICVEENIEFPSLLHLARAEYFFITSDYRSASQEATIAMKKSKNSGETVVLARTMNFLGRYCLRTGFFQESIDYFNNSIAIARKNSLKKIIPWNYNRLKDVYDALGNQVEYRNTLKLMIEAASDENDTLALETGYYRLGTSYTSKERDFKRADSLLRRSLELSLITKDTAFTALCLSNLGWNYYLEKMYDSAIKHYNKSLTYSIPAKIHSNSANSLGNLGTIYRDIGDTEKSIKYYLKSVFFVVGISGYE
jgi:tetratricopeptide (TPR) repeat protein